MPGAYIGVCSGGIRWSIQFFVAELQQSGDVSGDGFPHNTMVNITVVVSDGVSHRFHGTPHDTVCGFFLERIAQSTAELADLENRKADGSLVIQIGSIDSYVIPVPLDGVGNGNAIVPNMAKSLQIRRQHTNTPFLLTQYHGMHPDWAWRAFAEWIEP